MRLTETPCSIISTYINITIILRLVFKPTIPIPNINCVNCLLQVIQFMAEHAKNADGDYSYHHCAVVNITADPAKPIDTRWGQASTR